jgi:hypothetical protein
VKVQYLCPCVDDWVEVEVPERQPALGVVPWVEQVVASRIGQDHAARSPRCARTTIDQVRIPVLPGTQDIGRTPPTPPTPPDTD